MHSSSEVSFTCITNSENTDNKYNLHGNKTKKLGLQTAKHAEILKPINKRINQIYKSGMLIKYISNVGKLHLFCNSIMHGGSFNCYHDIG